MPTIVLARSVVEAPSTSGPPPNEQAFLVWYRRVAAKLQIDPNPDAFGHFYDYRAFYRDMLSGKVVSPDQPGGHFPSTYKLPGHPRAFLADSHGKVFDTRTGLYLDGGRVPAVEIARAERAPDLPLERRPQGETDPRGFAIVRGNLSLPRMGAWTADLVVDTNRLLEGRVELRVGPAADLVLVGTVSRAGITAGLLHARIVGGSNGLRRLVKPRHYTTPNARLVLADLLSDVGEALGPSEPAVLNEQLEHWTTVQMPCAQAIKCVLGRVEKAPGIDPGIAWRIAPDGSMTISHEFWPDSDVKDFTEQRGASPQADVWKINVIEPLVLPGTTLAGRRVGAVFYEFNGRGLSTSLWVDS